MGLYKPHPTHLVALRQFTPIPPDKPSYLCLSSVGFHHLPYHMIPVERPW